MAYGCQASLEHAAPRLEMVSALMAKRLETARSIGRPTTEEEALLRELVAAVSYLHDAIRYLKDGVP